MTTKTPFGSHSEYGTLREVVIGSAQDLTLPPFGKDLLHYNPELRAALEATGGKSLPIADHFPDRLAKTAEQIEGIANIYEANGVVVHRLRAYTDTEKHHADFLQPGCSQLYPADPVFVIGEHFLEINIRRAYRRKEIFPIREVVLPLIEADAAAKYIAMPPPEPWSPSGEGPGPYLEGGDILVVGEDVLVGVGALCTNTSGVEWLRRYLAGYGYRVHALPIRDDVLHALGAMCLLREGLVMAHSPALPDGLPAPIRDWEVIEITAEEMAGHATVGVSLDASRYMMNPQHARVMDELAKRGIEPLPTPSDALSFWGGAIRCLTLPLRRDAN